MESQLRLRRKRDAYRVCFPKRPPDGEPARPLWRWFGWLREPLPDPNEMRLRAWAARIVLADISRFCHAEKTTTDDNPFIAVGLSMRREVWLRIQGYLNLTDEQISQLAVEADQEEELI